MGSLQALGPQVGGSVLACLTSPLFSEPLCLAVASLPGADSTSTSAGGSKRRVCCRKAG